MTRTMSRELATLHIELAQWRKQGGGGRGKRIPARLWQQAAAVARVEGVHRTSRATRLNYERLKACVLKSEAVVPQGQSPRTSRASAKQSRRSERAGEVLRQSGRESLAGADAQFVSVQMPTLGRRDSLTIELISRSGERMRIESAGALDLAGVMQSFWSTRP